MLLTTRIEMRSGAFERRPFALRHLVDVNCVLTGWKILQIQHDLYAAVNGRDPGCADAFALAVFHLDGDRPLGGGANYEN